MSQSPIILTGFMCSGKTRVASALGEMLGCRVVDLDSRISGVRRQTPKEIIVQDGEECFRELETQILAEVLQERVAHVIALGGGAWTLDRNRELIKSFGATSVWLNVPFEVCWARILRGGASRPLATSEEEARALYAKRYPIYALADIRIDADAEKTIELIAREIASLTPAT